MRKLLFLQIVLFLFFGHSIFCQINIDYVPDWPYLFFSNTYNTTDKTYHADNYKQIVSIEENLFTTGFSVNSFYKEKTKDNIYRSAYLLRHNNNFYLPLKIFPLPVVIGLHSKIVHKEIDYNIIQTQSLKLINISDFFSFSILGALWKDYFYLMGKLGRTVYGNNKYYPWSLGFQFLPVPEFSFWYQRNSNNSQWENSLVYQGSPISFEQPEDIESEEFEISTKIIPKCNIKAFIENSNINKDYKRPQEKTILMLEGFNYNRKYTIELSPSDSLRFKFNYNYSLTNTPGRLYHWGSYSGQMTAWNFFSETINIESSYSNENSNYSAGFSWGKIYTRQRLHRFTVGNFTSIWVTLLGKFYSINSKLKYNFERYSINYKFKQTTWKAEFLAAFERIYPWGKIKTTEIDIIIPVGGDLYIPEISRQDGFYLGFRIEKNFSKNIQISYQGSQYIPVDFRKGIAGKTSTTADKKKHTVYGGGQHVLQFSLLF